MKRSPYIIVFSAMILLMSFTACGPERFDRKVMWERDKVYMKEIVELLKAGQLKRLENTRGTYLIPDSIDLHEDFGNKVNRETDFANDSTYSVVFYPMNLSGTVSFGTGFVYTNNSKRIEEYTAKSVEKLEDNWYFRKAGR